MAPRSPVSASTRAYMERKLACVDQRRAHSPDATELARLLAALQAPEERTRAEAVRQLCPCRLPWGDFRRVRKAAQRLRRDPSPLVRAQARHIEEDAGELAALEALRERVEERDAGREEAARRRARRDKRADGWAPRPSGEMDPTGRS